MRKLDIAVAAALVLVASPAAAAVRFTLEGVVTSGSDNGSTSVGQGAPFGSNPYATNTETGQTFGTPMGRAFTLVVTVDPTRGQRADTAFGREVYGDNAASPSTAALTLNGFTYEFGNFDATSASTGLSKFNDFIFGGAPTDALVGDFISTQDRPAADGPFTTHHGSLSFSVFLQPSTFQTVDFAESVARTDVLVSRYGFVNLTVRDTLGSGMFVFSGPERTADLRLRFDKFSAAFDPPSDVIPGVVPEPSTWAMMILGFGAIGAALRRRPIARVTLNSTVA
jgi:hypothetical protein